jgi:biopolymer transport protein ExbD
MVAPNVTPLTEVLVMAIIVMVTALARVEQTREEQTQVTQQSEQTDQVKRSGLKLTLPESTEQEIDTSGASLVLMLPIQGDVEIGGKAMHDADIDAVFAAAFQRDKGTQLTLKADKRVPHAKIVDLMERAKGAGLTHLAIATAGGSGSVDHE